MHGRWLCRLTNKPLRIDFGYNITSSLTGIQLGIGRDEISIRFDLVFVGLYIGIIW